MADKLGLNNEIRELKLGTSFYKKDSPFHTIKYDFKPASVDTSQMANLEIGSSNEVSVTVPHLEGSGTTQTVFKGSKRPYTKECILIIDHKTGEITLERLGLNIQLKKTRAEGSSKVNRSMPTMDLIAGSKKLHAKQHGQKEPQKSRKVSPPRVSPTMKSSAGLPGKASSQASSSSKAKAKPAMNTSASMPTLGLRDELDSPIADMTQSSAQSVGLMLTDSSSESGSSSSSDTSDSEDPDMEPVPSAPTPQSANHISPLKGSPLKPHLATGVQKGQPSFNAASSNNSFASSKPKNPPIASNLLNDDLCLSESGSDSD